jgi:hypothetical protein
MFNQILVSVYLLASNDSRQRLSRIDKLNDIMVHLDRAPSCVATHGFFFFFPTKFVLCCSDLLAMQMHLLFVTYKSK